MASTRLSQGTSCESARAECRTPLAGRRGGPGLRARGVNRGVRFGRYRGMRVPAEHRPSRNKHDWRLAASSSSSGHPAVGAERGGASVFRSRATVVTASPFTVAMDEEGESRTRSRRVIAKCLVSFQGRWLIRELSRCCFEMRPACESGAYERGAEHARTGSTTKGAWFDLLLRPQTAGSGLAKPVDLW